MHGVHELCAVERVGGREDAAREEAELHEARDGLVLGGLGGARREPGAALRRQPRHHAPHVLRLPPPLLLHTTTRVHITTGHRQLTSLSILPILTELCHVDGV